MRNFVINIYGDVDDFAIECVKGEYEDIDIPIKIYKWDTAQSALGCRCNVAVFAHSLDDTIVNEIVVPSAMLAPKDVWEITPEPHYTHVKRYSGYRSYKKYYTNPEDRVNKWVEENL